MPYNPFICKLAQRSLFLPSLSHRNSNLIERLFILKYPLFYLFLPLPFLPIPIAGPFLLQCYQVGSQPSTAMFHSEENGSKGMDPLVLIDAIAICMAYEEKELCKIGEVALAVIFDVASIILGSKERVIYISVFFFFFYIQPVQFCF